jgi:hypothetical protein
MEASLNATRMMVMNPAETKPTWANSSLDIDTKGNLVDVGERTPGQISGWEPSESMKVVAPANFHFAVSDKKKPEEAPASRPRGGGVEAK